MPLRIWLDRSDDRPVLALDRLQPLLPPDCEYRAVDLSPDGRVVTGLRDGAAHIFGFAVLALDGTVQELYAQDFPYIVNPIWSPDGSAIAFIAAQDAEGMTSGLYVLDLASGVIRRTGGVGYHDIYRWCPDNVRLCVVDDIEEGHNAVYIVARDGTERRYVCDLNRGDLSGEIDPAWPAWSPDGRLLVVSTIPEAHDYSVLDFYTPTGLLIHRTEWPQARLVRIDDVQWQPSA